MTVHRTMGGAVPLAAIDAMQAWEANFVLNMRLWCDGPQGKMIVSKEFHRALPDGHAEASIQDFDSLISDICQLAHRPLVRHEVSCNCVGADECVVLHLVRMASAGQLADAALISSLLVGSAHAERIALLAGLVGEACRQLVRSSLKTHEPYRANRFSGRVH